MDGPCTAVSREFSISLMTSSLLRPNSFDASLSERCRPRSNLNLSTLAATTRKCLLPPVFLTTPVNAPLDIRPSITNASIFSILLARALDMHLLLHLALNHLAEYTYPRSQYSE